MSPWPRPAEHPVKRTDMQKENALIVFAKRPVPGRVKTRLSPPLTPEEAARLYEAFLRDALAQYAALGVAVRLYVSPPAEPLPKGLLADLPSVQLPSVHVQTGDGLGARMQHAFLETFAAGYERAVIIGTDHPTLPEAFIAHAFEALAEPLSVVLGPSDDGGYYLLGMNDFYPALFAGMHYSHPDVFRDTMTRVGQTRAALTVLPPWYDVDTPETLQRLAEELRDAAVAAVAAPHTRRVMAGLADEHRDLLG